MTKNINLVLIFLILTSCGGFKLKKANVDEFLVEKKGPLVLPPDYNEIPAPDTIIEKNENDENKIKRILKAPINENKATNNSSSVEKSILEKIRKWTTKIYF